MSRRSFGTRRRRRFGFRSSKATQNHYETTLTHTAATELQTTLATGVDDASNRSSHIPDGAILRRVVVIAQGTTIPAATQKFQSMLFYRPGGLTVSSTAIADYFATTDPLTAQMIQVRRYKLRGPFTQTKAASDFTPTRIKLSWKGRIRWRDGDDLILATLSEVNYTMNAQVYLTYTY